MALPNSRNTTYVDGAPIIAADLNDIQDEIVDGYARWSAKQTWTQNLYDFLTISGTWSVTNTGAPNGNGKVTINASSGEILIGLNLPVGGKLDGLNVRVQDGGTATTLIAARVQGWDDTGNVSFQPSSVISSGTGVRQTLTQTGLNHTITDGRYFLQLFLTGGGSALRTVWWASVSVFMPL